MSAGVIAANVARKIITSGEFGTASDAASNPRPKAYSRLPMNDPLPPNASEYAPSTQSRGTTSRHQKFIINMLRTFLPRAMPP